MLADPPLSPLDSGRPDAARQPFLAALACDDVFLPRRVANRDMAGACRAGLWLLFDFLDESHALSQELHNSEGAYWHALMHRRENDFSNSKYWFRRVGVHPVYAPLQAVSRDLAGDAPDSSAQFLGTNAAWNPFAFVDLCEASLAGRSPCEALCRRVQQCEWQFLFDYCYRRAVHQDCATS
ncbi:MAG TPA: hypothetical protein DDY78_00615 [Planctomycetales bacterium]|nr:hypothetical protein [Planctomycetales bacterium]